MVVTLPNRELYVICDASIQSPCYKKRASSGTPFWQHNKMFKLLKEIYIMRISFSFLFTTAMPDGCQLSG